MSKFIRFGLAFLLIGLALVLIVSKTTNADIFVIDDENYTLHEQDFDADIFESFYFDLDNRNVYILESEDENIHLEYYTHEKDISNLEDTDAELNLTISRKWYYNIFSFNIFTDKEYYKVYLYLPLDIIVNTLEISTSNGRIKCESENAFSIMRLISSNGKIDLANFSTENLLAATSNGDIELRNIEVNDSTTLNTSNGDIIIESLTTIELNADTSNGKISALNIVAEDIDLDSSNGRVDLLVIGNKNDYRVNLSTSNGDRIYDGLRVDSGTINSSGSKIISLDSSNGDVEVNFTE